MRSTGIRRASTVLLTGLIAALLPLIGAADPAHATPECLTEAYDEPLLLTGCDDETPPQTTLGAVSPSRNGQGYVRSTSVAFNFTGAHTDADTDEIAFECMLYNTASPPAEDVAANWTSCVSGVVYSDLEQYGAVPYTFKVRAKDVPDSDPLRPALDGNALTSPDPDLADHDLTPASTTIKVDTVAPNTFLTRPPTDELRPDWPVTLTTSPQVTLNTNEAGTFKCLLNGKNYPCRAGVNSLRNLSGGNKTLVARAVDRAGNIDPTASSTKFWVPNNIKKAGTSWKRVKSPGYFGNDYLTADEVGATLQIKGQRGVEEVRLFAPTGPRSGKIEVKVGKSQWYTINLRSKTPVRQQMYLVRDEYTTTRNGSIEIRVKSLPKGGSVSVDAYVARR